MLAPKLLFNTVVSGSRDLATRKILRGGGGAQGQ